MLHCIIIVLHQYCIGSNLHYINIALQTLQANIPCLQMKQFLFLLNAALSQILMNSCQTIDVLQTLTNSWNDVGRIRRQIAERSLSNHFFVDPCLSPMKNVEVGGVQMCQVIVVTARMTRRFCQRQEKKKFVEDRIIDHFGEVSNDPSVLDPFLHRHRLHVSFGMIKEIHFRDFFRICKTGKSTRFEISVVRRAKTFLHKTKKV